MEAQKNWHICVLVIAVCTAISTQNLYSQTYQANSRNFTVYAANSQLAQKASKLAEQYRRELALEWLGYELQPWKERCPIYIQVGPHAGGETSFAFVQGGNGQSQPVSWQMKIYGPVDRLLDAVLPHEITHTIFATHFGQPLPRWADEGACTTVEHESERAKNHQMLMSFLSARPSRGIPFNRMFTMKQYPHDILPLYAQGYSVARYLIGQKGRQHFVQYLEKGMSLEQSDFDTQAWDAATCEYYGYDNLSDLQLNWESWVRSGSPKQTPDLQIATTPPAGKIDNLIDPQATYSIASNQSDPAPESELNSRTSVTNNHSWYARESRAKHAVNLPDNSNSTTGFRPGSLKRSGLSTEMLKQLKSDSTQLPKSTIWR